MLRLIKNELYKIFHKKSTWIFLVITILFSCLVTYIYGYSSNNNYYLQDLNYQKEEYLNELEVLDKENDKEEYARILTNLEIIKLKEEYKKEKWQYYVLNSKVVEDAIYLSFLENNDNYYQEVKKHLNSDDWLYFANKELEELNIAKDTITDKKEKEAQIQLFVINTKIDNLKYRINNNIEYKDDYLNRAIESVNNSAWGVAQYKYASELDKENYEYDLSTYYENKYVLETKEDTNSTNTLREILINYTNEFFFLILVFGIMISGSIVSDELSKGTIKSLLTTPYKRYQILLSKFISIIIMLILYIIFSISIQLLIGGIFLGFNTLSIPFIKYNLASYNLEVLNIFKYLFIKIIAMLPQIILLMTLAFSLSTIFGSTSLGVAISFCGFIGSNIINALALSYNIPILDYFITTNWEFNYYLFGGTSPFDISLTRAIITCILYFIFMIIVTFVFFNKKDIKNI